MRQYMRLVGRLGLRGLADPAYACPASCRMIYSGKHDDELPDSIDDPMERPTTPWVRQVVSGVDLMRHPKYNKGLAFSFEEREKMYLRGLLPPAILSQEKQVERTLLNIRSKVSDLSRYTYLQNLQERNERLFYRVLEEYFTEMLPVLHVPTVHEACHRYGLMFKSLPRGMFITPAEKGYIFQVLKNWPERRVKMVAITTGEAVGPAGDLGVHAINAVISKLALCTAAGGIAPSVTMPLVVDVGTNNQDLLRSPFYVGVRNRRMSKEYLTELVDDLLIATGRRFGATTMLMLEDMCFETVRYIMTQYRTRFPCYSDDYQGVPTMAVAALLSACQAVGQPLWQQVILIAGDGPQAASTAELIATAAAKQRGVSTLEARHSIWMVNSRGLISRTHPDHNDFPDYLLPYCHEGKDCHDLLSAVQTLKPSMLIGCQQQASRWTAAFNREICQAMASNHASPVILSLSPTPECSPKEAYAWTEGRCLYAARDTLCSTRTSLPDGRERQPSFLNTVYLFPGLAMGTMACRANRIREEQLIAVAEELCRSVTEEERAAGALLPSMSRIAAVSRNVAQVVATIAYDQGFATELPRPTDLGSIIDRHWYRPQYRRYR